MGRGKIRGFDGMRALAALMVVFSHHAVYRWMGLDFSGHPEVVRLLNPTLGVKVFFVLSGFLITYLLLREEDKHGKINLLQFYARRALRLLPLYFVVVILLLVMTLIGSATMDIKAFPYLFTYTQNYMPREYNYSSISHLWSLAVEEHFYLVWPFLFMVGRKFAAAVAVIFVAAAFTIGQDLSHHYTFPAAGGIAIGCLLAYAIRNDWVASVMTHSVFKRVILAIGVVGLLSPADRYREHIFVPAVALVVAFVFFNQDSIITRVLDIKPLAMIGVMSYGLYVWHAVLGGTGSYRDGLTAFPVEMHTGTILTILIVPLSYYGLEKPFLDFKDRFRRSPDRSSNKVVNAAD